MTKGVWTAAVMAAVILAAGPAEACRSSKYALSVTFDEAPAALAREPLVLRVKITRLQRARALAGGGRLYAWADVVAVEKGAFPGKRVRIDLRTTSCGPRPQAGETGLIIGRLTTASDGRPVFLPRYNSPALREARNKKLRP